MQKKTFQKWVNSHLVRVNHRIGDLYVDLRDGKMLLKLLEVLSGERLVSSRLDYFTGTTFLPMRVILRRRDECKYCFPSKSSVSCIISSKTIEFVETISFRDSFILIYRAVFRER